MKKSVIYSFLSILVAMAVLPCLIRFAPGQWGIMLYPLILLYINPIFFLGLGFYAGGQLHRRWYLPLISAVVFVIAESVMFSGTLVDGADSGVFLVYALYYLICGALAIGIRWLFRKK